MRQVTRKSRAAALWSAMIVLSGAVLPFAPSVAPAAQAAVLESGDAGKEIVYIDGEVGFIRVLDTTFAGTPQVQWISPEADFREFALGDVNGDGDMEIIGIKGDGTEAKPGKVIVYDPVKAKSDEFPAEKINGIPWNTLFTLTVAGKPLMIAAGEFDTGVTGAEFAVGYEVPPFTPPGDTQEKSYALTVYKNASNTSGGRTWVQHIPARYFEEKWNRSSVGQIVAGATDELVVVDESSGKLEVYRFDEGFARIFDVGDSKKQFSDAAVGPWDPNDGSQIAAVRDVVQPGVSFFIWDWDEGDRQMDEDPKSAFDPAPRRVAMIDVDGKGEKEIFLLRNLPTGRDGPRMIVFNRGDRITDWTNDDEAELGGDNEWRAITGGDLDGNGKEELILGRTDKIRVYNEADRRTDNRVDYSTNTNRRSIATGNLDAVGFVEGPQFFVDKTEFNITATAGGAVVNETLQLKNAATPDSVPYSIVVEGNPAWLTVNPLSGSTPPNFGNAQISLEFDPSNLLPGISTTRLMIDSSAEVSNAPLTIDVVFTVLAAAVNVNPTSLFFNEPYSGTNDLQSKAVSLTGTGGTKYTAAILALPDVAAAAAELGNIQMASLSMPEGVSGAALEGATAITFVNATGKSVTIPLAMPAAGALGAASPESVWPSGVPWAAASSVDDTLPDALTVTVDPTLATENPGFAMLVIFADARAGAPPSNVRFVPLLFMRTTPATYMPIIGR